MSTIVKFDGLFKAKESTTDELLEELCKYGRPRLSKHKEGWHVGMDVFVCGKGVDFTVSTDFNQATPHAALTECHSRLTQAMAKIKEI